MLLPPEIVDHIVDFVDDRRTLKACSLVAKGWAPRSQVHLFRQVHFRSHRRWKEIMPVGDASPARHTRTLTLEQGTTPRRSWINTDNLYHFPHLYDFRNVETLILAGWLSEEFTKSGLKKYFSHFGQCLRTLKLSGECISADHLLVLLGHLPNLENLIMKEPVYGMRTARVLAVTPKLSGRLIVSRSTNATFPTLCKLPLRFREIRLHTHLYDFEGLVRACADTLMEFRAMFMFDGEQGLRVFSPTKLTPARPTGKEFLLRRVQGPPRSGCRQEINRTYNSRSHSNRLEHHLQVYSEDYYRVHGVDNQRKPTRCDEVHRLGRL